MQLETVKSSSVYALGYDPIRGVISIVWKGYEYPGTREQFEAIKNAPSIGAAVASLVGGGRVTPPAAVARRVEKVPRPGDSTFAVTK